MPTKTTYLSNGILSLSVLGLVLAALIWNSQVGLVFAAVMSLVVTELLRHREPTGFRVSTNFSLLVLVLVFAQSVNYNEGLDLTSTGFLVCIYVFTAVILKFVKISKILFYVAIAISIVSLISLMLGLLQPATAVMNTITGDSLLKGLYPHRNLLGLYTGLALVVLFTQLFSRTFSKGKMMIWVLVVVDLLALIWARSMTSMTALGLALVMFLFLKYFRRGTPTSLAKRLLFIVGILVLTLLLLLSVGDSQSLTGLVSKDETLTGRTQIWSLWFQHIYSLGPLGVGWSSAWSPGESFTTAIVDDFGFPIAHAHNIILDMWTRGGLLAPVILVVIFVFGFRNTLRKNSKFLGQATTILPVQLYIFVAGISESLLYLPVFMLIFGAVFGARSNSDSVSKPIKPIPSIP